MNSTEIQLISKNKFARLIGELKQNNLKAIKITRLHNDMIPYLDLFIDHCGENGCPVHIPEYLLIAYGIRDNFKDRIIIL
jgi:hypothetical protein